MEVTPEALHKAYTMGIDLKHIKPANGRTITESDIDRFVADIRVGKHIAPESNTEADRAAKDSA
jgi:hypothetical protein